MSQQRTSSRPLLARVDRRALSMVEDLFRNTAPRLRTRLVNRVGGDVPVRFGAASVCSLGEVFDRLHGHGAAIGQFQVAHRDGSVRGVVVLEGALVHRLVGLMLGESSDGQPGMTSNRALTNIDLRLAHRLCEDVLEGMCDASSVRSRPQVELDNVTPTSRAVSSLPRSATVLESTLDFGPPDAPFGLASVLLPAQANGVLWTSKDHAEHRMALGDGSGIQRVLPVQVQVVAELTRKSLPLSRLRALEVGDTIPLDTLQSVELRVGGRTALHAEAGEQDGVRSVRIKGRASRG